MRLRVLIHIVLCIAVQVLGASAEEPTKMAINGVPPDAAMTAILGSHWAIYLDGPIDGEVADRLEAYIAANRIPDESHVILNSPGGSLVGGLELGRVIRKHKLTTDVGKRTPGAKRRLEYTEGQCYSACTIAFLGGRFRYLKSGSRFGVHRFAFSSAKQTEAAVDPAQVDLAQIVSAAIVSYLREMNVDTEFFTLTTQAGPSEMIEPTSSLLTRLNIVNHGFEKVKWSVESNGFLYLKGERATVYGMNKWTMSCPVRGEIMLYVMFDPQGRQAEVMKLPAHSLVIDGRPQPITPTYKEIVNGWFTAAYTFTNTQVTQIAKARSVGYLVQPAYNAPIFLGFDQMPFDDGAEKLTGILRSCASATPARPR